jgi:hypothetical protein
MLVTCFTSIKIIKNPACFDRFTDHHQGLSNVPRTITTCQLFRYTFQYCGCMFLYVRTRSVHIYTPHGLVQSGYTLTETHSHNTGSYSGIVDKW